ncbi:hypothetical protein, partial [Paenibacillus kobensis]|uniref:hypothetical protein n=1 Tax=Paenibacillus kobensis TaxID=59841 RepID=UPI001C3F5E7A
MITKRIAFFATILSCFMLLLSSVVNAASFTYIYTDDGKLQYMKNPDGTYMKYTYDANGNTTKRQKVNLSPKSSLTFAKDKVLNITPSVSL